jgi:hypothetical protein
MTMAVEKKSGWSGTGARVAQWVLGGKGKVQKRELIPIRRLIQLTFYLSIDLVPKLIMSIL